MTDLPKISIKGKDYVLVKDRILAFNEMYPNGGIETERFVEGEREIIKATVYPDCSNKERKFTGRSQAIRGDGYINKTSALENAETSAVGRALAMMGIGVIDSIASVDEIVKAESQSETKKEKTKCSDCGVEIDSEAVVKYSQDKFGKILCIGCQKKQ